MFGWRVVGVGDGVWDGVVVEGGGFSTVADIEGVVGGGDGGGDESSYGDRFGDGPFDAGDVDCVVLGDVSDERYASGCEGNDEVALTVEVVVDADGWEPSQCVGVGCDVFGGVAGAAQVGVQDGSSGVEPCDGPVRSGPYVVEAVEVLDPDGFALPFIVDGFDVVGPTEVAGWRDDDFDTEEETDPGPDREWVVGVRG